MKYGIKAGVRANPVGAERFLGEQCYQCVALHTASNGECQQLWVEKYMYPCLYFTTLRKWLKQKPSEYKYLSVHLFTGHTTWRQEGKIEMPEIAANMRRLTFRQNLRVRGWRKDSNREMC